MLTSTDSLSCLLVSSVVLVSTIGPESSTTLPSSNTICRLTRVSMCRVVVNSVFFFVTTSSTERGRGDQEEMSWVRNEMENEWWKKWIVEWIMCSMNKWMIELNARNSKKTPRVRQLWAPWKTSCLKRFWTTKFKQKVLRWRLHQNEWFLDFPSNWSDEQVTQDRYSWCLNQGSNTDKIRIACQWRKKNVIRKTYVSLLIRN